MGAGWEHNRGDKAEKIFFYVGIRSRSRTKLSGSNGCHTSGRLGPEWDDFLLKFLLFGVVYL